MTPQRALHERAKDVAMCECLTCTNALRKAALAYAESLGWLSPERAVEQDKAMAERDAMLAVGAGDRERVRVLEKGLREIAERLARLQAAAR